MRTATALILAFLSSLATYAQSPASAPAKDKDDIITIDGSKNPEMIPQWSAWRSVFDAITRVTTHVGESGLRGEDAMPTVFCRGPSHQERLVLMKDAEDAVARYKDCEAQAVKARDQLLANGIADAKSLQHAKDTMSDINMECRRVTLDSRDHLLQKLSPETQTVLLAFVEHLKKGTVIEVAKSDLAKFRLPE